MSEIITNRSWPQAQGGSSQEWPCELSSCIITRDIHYTMKKTLSGGGNCAGQTVDVYSTHHKQTSATGSRQDGRLTGRFNAGFSEAASAFPRYADSLDLVGNFGPMPPIQGWEWSGILSGSYSHDWSTDYAECVETAPDTWELRIETQNYSTNGNQNEYVYFLTPRLWFLSSWQIVFEEERLQEADRNYPCLSAELYGNFHIHNGKTCSLNLEPDLTVVYTGYELVSYSETFTVQFS